MFNNIQNNINSLQELDCFLEQLDASALISDDELRKGFKRFSMEYPNDLPKDPFSKG
jgi:hypothetical protein